MAATGTPTDGRPSMMPVALAAGVLGAVTCISAAAGDGIASLNAAAVAAGDIDDAVLAGDRDAAAIAVRNLGAIALLAAGAPMLGILTVLAVAVIGMGQGLSGASVIAALGPAETHARVSPYIAFELTGVVLATAAGLLPTVHAARAALRTRDRAPFLIAYTRGLRASLVLAGVAAGLIVIAAGIEAVVISAHLT